MKKKDLFRCPGCKRVYARDYYATNPKSYCVRTGMVVGMRRVKRLKKGEKVHK